MDRLGAAVFHTGTIGHVTRAIPHLRLCHKVSEFQASGLSVQVLKRIS